MQVVLVGIDADPQHAFVGGGLQNTDPGAASCRIDHVRALRFLGFGQLATLHRVIPGRRRGAGIVHDDLAIGLGRQEALTIAAFELVNQRNVHAADEADRARFRGICRHDPGQIRALAFVEDVRLHVRLIDDHVDDDEFGIRVIGCDLAQHLAKGEAGHDDRVGAGFGQPAKRLFALRLGLHFQFLIGAAGLGLPTLGAGIGGFVEGFVELAAQIEDQRGFGKGGARQQTKRRGRGKDGFEKGHGNLLIQAGDSARGWHSV